MKFTILAFCSNSERMKHFKEVVSCGVICVTFGVKCTQNDTGP